MWTRRTRLSRCSGLQRLTQCAAAGCGWWHIGTVGAAGTHDPAATAQAGCLLCVHCSTWTSSNACTDMLLLLIHAAYAHCVSALCKHALPPTSPAPTVPLIQVTMRMQVTPSQQQGVATRRWGAGTQAPLKTHAIPRPTAVADAAATPHTCPAPHPHAPSAGERYSVCSPCCCSRARRRR